MASIKVTIKVDNLEPPWATESYIERCASRCADEVLEKEYGVYGSTWGLTSFYEGFEKMLKQAFDSGFDFEANWGAKKEIRYASIKREEGVLRIKVSESTDSGYGLADTVFWDALEERHDCGESAIRKELGIPGSFDLESFYDAFFGLFHGDEGFALDYDTFNGNSVSSKQIDGTPSWEDLLQVIDELEEEVSALCEERYQEFVKKAKQVIGECKKCVQGEQAERLSKFEEFIEGMNL